MTWTRIAANGVVSDVSQVNQIIDGLTGATTDQPITVVQSQQTVTETVLVSGVDPKAGTTVFCTLTANRVVGAPLNPVAGQRIHYVFTENGTGGWTLTFNPIFSLTNWALNTAANARTELTVEYDAAAVKWVVAQNPPNGAYGSKTNIIVAPMGINLQAEGADMSGNSSSDAVVTAALAKLPSNSGRIYIGSGQLRLDNPFPITSRNDLTVFGDGPNATQVFINGNGDVFSISGVCSRIKLRDMWLGNLSGAPRASGYGVNATGTDTNNPGDHLELENLRIQNTFLGYKLKYQQHPRIRNVKYLQSVIGASGAGGIFLFQNVIGGNVWGGGIQTVSASLGTTNAKLGGDGVVVDYDCDSIEFDGLNVVGGGGGFGAGNGLLLTQSAGSTGPRLVRFQNSWFESFPNMGVNVQAGRDLWLEFLHAWVNSQRGFYVAGGTSVNLVAPSAVMNQQHGIHVVAGTAVKIWLPSCSDNSQAADFAWDGIRVDGAMVGQVDIVGGKSGNFIFAGANQQQYGARIGAADATDHVTVLGLDVKGNRQSVNSILVSSTVATPDIRVSDCPGFNPLGPANVVPGASPWTYTNKDGVDEDVYLQGGTVTTLVKGGQTLDSLGGAAIHSRVSLAPGEAFTLTYTVAPTVTVDKR